MRERFRTIAVCNDFLRDGSNQLDNGTYNRVWLAAVARYLAGSRFQVVELGSDQPSARHLDTPKFMRSLDLPSGHAGWAAAWDGEPSDRFVEELASRLEGIDLVVGWGLPNVVVRALEALSVRFLDFELSPLRFARNLHLDARTNMPLLAECPAWQMPLEAFNAAAVDYVGWAARFCPDTIPAGAGAVGVIFGQTAIDAALLHDGRIAEYSGFVPMIRQWADGLDHVLFRQHPYATDSQAFEQLHTIVPHVRPTLMSSYQLLASQRLSRVLALSSGIIDEAAFFQTPATRLFMPKRRTSGLRYTMAANLALLDGDLLAASLDGANLPPVAIHEFDLRKQFRATWGLTDTPVPSDFREQPAPEPTVCIEVAPPQHKPKLRHRLRRLARTVASFALSGGSTRYRSTPAVIPPAAAVPIPVSPSKDFSYGSGERQTAHDYAQIRRDHRARYELAHQLLPHDIAVLDLFCGNGYGSSLLSKNRTVLGVDGSKPAIEIADRCFRRSGARFDARCYPFDDQREYDAIVSYESIEHVPDGGEFFRFLVQHLRPGGWILYSTPNEELLPFNRNVHIHHYRHYTRGETLDFARSCELMIESWYGQNVYESIAEGRATLLAEDGMELQRDTPGQFTVVVARNRAA